MNPMKYRVRISVIDRFFVQISDQVDSLVYFQVRGQVFDQVYRQISVNP